MAKFDIKNDIKLATKPLYAGVGATDLAVERVRGFVTEAQKRTQKRVAEAQKSVRKVELEPKALRDQAVTRVDALAKDAKARRAAIEKRVAEAQADALATVGGTYDVLVTRGASLVTRIRGQEATQATDRGREDRGEQGEDDQDPGHQGHAVDRHDRQEVGRRHQEDGRQEERARQEQRQGHRHRRPADRVQRGAGHRRRRPEGRRLRARATADAVLTRTP